MTIATVAQHARVSRQTVSNVINAPHLVRPETRERVRAAIEALGYRVSQAARQMRTGRSRLIAVRIGPAGDGINGSVLDRFLHGLTEAAAPAGYRIVLYTAAGDDEEIAAYEELLGAHDLDGFVLTGTHPRDARTEWLARRGVPFVTFGRPWAAQPEPFFGEGDHAPTQHSPAQPEPFFGEGDHAPTQHSPAQPEPFFGEGDHAPTQHSPAQPEPGADLRAGRHPWVDVDGAYGTRDATRRLIAAGHRRIGFIGWPPGSAVGDDRRDGWAAALRAAGLQPDGLERRVPDGVAEGERAAADLLAAADPTALVCASDSLALGALRAATARETTARETTAREAAGSGARPGETTVSDETVPSQTTPDGSPARRIAVIGFDDTPVAQAVGLTSVSQPLAEAAAGCVALLTRLLDGASGREGREGREGSGSGDDDREGYGGAEHLLLRPRVVVRDSG